MYHIVSQFVNNFLFFMKAVEDKRERRGHIKGFIGDIPKTAIH